MLGTGKNISAYVEDGSEEKNGTTHSNLENDKVKEFKESVKKYLSKLVDYIDVNKAADAMCADFMASRLPPYGHVKPQDTEEEEEEEEPVILLDDKIKIKYPDHVRVVYDDEEENEDQDEEEDDWEDMEEDEKKPAVAAPGSASKSPKKSPKKNSSSAEVEDEDD